MSAAFLLYKKMPLPENELFKMCIRDSFYRDVLGFEIKESEDTSNVYLVKDGTLFLLYGRKDFENMTHRRYEYIKGLNGHRDVYKRQSM